MTPEELAAALEQERAAIAQLEAMPDVAQIPTAEPSWFERMQQMADVQPTSIGGRTSQEYAQAWTPAGIANELRLIPEEGTSIAGSIIGGAATGTRFGAPGAILGGALGSLSAVPVRAGFDWLLGTKPTTSRTQEALEQATLGAGAEALMRGAGVAGKAAAPVARKAGDLLANYLGPQTTEEAAVLVGKELPSIMVGRETAQTALGQAAVEQQLQQAAVEKNARVAAGLPGENLTVADLTGNEGAAQAEALLSSQPAGQANVTFAQTARAQIEDLDQAALKLTELNDPNPKRAGEAAKSLLESAREKQRAAAGELFTEEVRAIPAPVKNIAKDADAAYEAIYKDTGVLEPNSELDRLYRQVMELEKKAPTEKAPAGFGRQATTAKETPSETTVGKLQDLRSEALELSRNAKKGSRDELFADRLTELLGKRIDAVPGTESLATARSEWRKFKQRWFRTSDGQPSPLYTLLRKQNPEDIITSVSKKSAVSDEYAKILGGLEPNKLASEMADFVQQKTVQNKLDWIRSKRAIYVDSPIWPTIQQWEQTLKQMAGSKELAKVEGLSAENIDTQARSLIRALGGASSQAAGSAAEASGVSAARNVTRSNVTNLLGAGGVGALLGSTLGGVGTAAGGVLTAGGLWALEAARSGRVAQSTNLVAKALADALRNPETALEYIQAAKTAGAEQASRRAATDAAAANRASLLNALAPKVGAITRGTMSTTPELPMTSMPTETPIPQEEFSLEDIAAREQDLQRAIEARKAEEAAANTPAPETVQIGKQDISIPQGQGFAPPDLVKAVITVESAGNPKALSPKGAYGPMQLMPGTAEELGVDPKDPKQNIEGGSRYLAKQLTEFDDVRLALAAYNWGPGALSNAIKKLKAEDRPVTWENLKKYGSVPTETKNYVSKVLLLKKYDDYDLAKIAAKVGESKLDAALEKFKTGQKFLVGDLLDELGVSASDVNVKRNNVLQAANDLLEA
jgi:soluble lytic murein transglycosylase-like protein